MRYYLLLFIILTIACAGTPLIGTPLYTCPTDVPLPTATTLAGTPVSTPRPQPTPFTIVPPQDFYAGDAVNIGTPNSDLRVRLHLLNVQISPLGGDEQVVSWQLAVTNNGRSSYEIFPAVQMYVRMVDGVQGTWGSTHAAGESVGMSVDSDLYQIRAEQSRTFNLAAITPAGTDLQFAFQLDPTLGTASPIMTWINQTNPHCQGDVAL
ncbi:MAG: hypothetical protein AAFN11_06285 [Chloroflexota bacterium]